jgi:uncharacterized peroxidase-related enzyme
MAYIQTVSIDATQGKLHEMYEADVKNLGYVPNHAQVFSLRPDALEAWRALQASIRKNMRLRRYELVTLAAAQVLNCRYCLLAHGAILIKNGVSIDQLRAILKDFHQAELDSQEVAIMEFTRKVSQRANEVTPEDVEALRALGLEDVEILDITLAATLRSFASKTFNALGAEPDAVYADLEKQLADLLPA